MTSSWQASWLCPFLSSFPGCITVHLGFGSGLWVLILVLPPRISLSSSPSFPLACSLARVDCVKVRKRDETLLIWRGPSIDVILSDLPSIGDVVFNEIFSIPLFEVSFPSDLCLYLFTVRSARARVSFASHTAPKAIKLSQELAAKSHEN